MAGNIIVIDDESAIRKSFALALEDTNYRVDTVDSGKAGLEMLRKQSYNLAFLDLKMPEMSGVETLREIRKIDPAVPVYIVTAFYGEFFDELEELVAEGISFEVMRKPVDAAQIRKVVRGILEGPVAMEEQ